MWGRKKEKQEGHDPVAIANRFVEKAVRAGRPLTILHLVKMVYLAHAWRLGFSGRPLISAPVEAWWGGPAILEVYWQFRPQDVYNIDMTVPGENGEARRAELSAQEEDIVDQVYDNYSPLSADHLSALARPEDAPWSWSEGRHTLIPNDTIREYYAKRVRESRETARPESREAAQHG